MNARPRLPNYLRFGVGLALALACAVGLRAAPGRGGSASLSGFYLPGFGADGYKTWDIQGRESHLDATDDSRLEIADLLLQLYSGGEKARLEMTIRSAAATVQTASAETQVHGPNILYLTGAGDSYTVSGYDWSWNSKTHLIQLRRNVTVKFNSADQVPNSSPAQPAHPIIILSDSLEIDQQSGRNKFTFRGNISITDQQSKSDPQGEFHTTCSALEVIAIRASGGSVPAAATADDLNKLPASLAVDRDSVESIIAQDNVVMRQGAIEARGGHAQLYPNEEKVVLSDAPQVRVLFSGNESGSTNYAIMEGGTITWLRDRQVLDVTPAAVVPANGSPALVTVSLPSNSPPRIGATESRLIVTGEALHAQFGTERRFDIEKNVHVEDPRYTVDAQHLDAEFDQPLKDDKPAAPPPSGKLALTTDNATPQLGKLNHLALSNGVVIEQANLKATTPKAEILPEEQAILLSGGPHVVDTLSNAIINADSIKLTTDGRHADVLGAPGRPAQLVLPTLPLGETSANIETTILSNSVTMERGLEFSNFTFSDNVLVHASSLEMTSGQLDVFTSNVRTEPGADALNDPTKRVQIVQLVARNQVVITQPGFKALAAEAEVNPQVGNPKFAAGTSPDGEAKAYRMLQLRGDPTGVHGPQRPEVDVPLQSQSTVAMAGAATAAPTATMAKITSDEQWLFTSPSVNNYMFMGNVAIDGGSFTATCDRMLVNCVPAKATDESAATGSIRSLTVDNIVAESHVRLVQGDKSQRVSTADKALILPREDKAMLTGNVMVVDNETGRMQNADITITLHDGKPVVTTTASTPNDPLKRPTIILPASALHLDQIKKAAEKDSNKSAP